MFRALNVVVLLLQLLGDVRDGLEISGVFLGDGERCPIEHAVHELEARHVDWPRFRKAHPGILRRLSKAPLSTFSNGRESPRASDSQDVCPRADICSDLHRLGEGQRNNFLGIDIGHQDADDVAFLPEDSGEPVSFVDEESNTVILADVVGFRERLDAT